MDHKAKQPVAHTSQVDAQQDIEKADYEHPDSLASGLSYWQPGFFAQFPRLGAAAIGGVLACLIASIVVLVCSNGKTQTRIHGHVAWPKAVSPNVLVSIFNSVANICFGVGISNGVAIAWWRRALKGGTIKELNRSWQFSSSIKEIFLAGKYFNIIALTALVAKMTIIDSTLLQKSIGTYTQTDYIGLELNATIGYINKTFPTTGLGCASCGQDSALQPWFNRDLEIWSIGGGNYPNQFDTFRKALKSGQAYQDMSDKTYNKTLAWGSTAYVNMSGAGFAIDCRDPVVLPINISSLSAAGNILMPTSELLFSINFTAMYSNTVLGLEPVAGGPDAWMNNTSYIKMEATYSNATKTPMDDGSFTCPGQMTMRTCYLRPAVVTYPVLLSQRGDEETWSAQLDAEWYGEDYFYVYNKTGQQQNYFVVEEYQDTMEFPGQAYTSGAYNFGNNSMGGLAAGLQTYLGGQAWVSKSSDLGIYNLNATGTAVSYLDNLPDIGQCNYHFSNPLVGGRDLVASSANDFGSKFVDPGTIGKINSIMFGLASDVGLLDANYDQHAWWPIMDASIYADTIHYSTNFYYMGGAIASTLLCILCVLPSYWGFWQLGRKVTLGPFEIAAAFRAPNLYHPTHANAPVDELIKEVGSREVRFGQIMQGSDAGRIGVAEPEYVQRVKPKINVAGEEIRGRWRDTFSGGKRSRSR